MEKRMKRTHFEYLDGDSIDEELKCAVCVKPLNVPVYAPQCGHTFCQDCIQRWLRKSSICPTCRTRVNINDYTPVKTRVVLNQLSRLLMKCTLCEQINIEDRDKHKSICPKVIVKCISVVLKCSWNGKREDLDLHLQACPFTSIHPILEEFKQQLETIRINQIEQQDFFQAFINKGYPLSRDCTLSSCYIKNPSTSSASNLMSCSLCKKQKEPDDISVHSCLTMSCICEFCFEKHTKESAPFTFKRKLSSDDDDDGHFSNNDDESDSF